VSADKKKVLLVDDNHDILDILEIYLYRDFSITSAVNGFEGLVKARQIKPDCIITDIMMPVMDGIKFFNNLRKEEANAGTPVIGVTSFVRKITIKSLLNMGFKRVLTKPLSRDDVMAAVKEALAAGQVFPPDIKLTAVK
jgi:CheY-like chemotaxis protein